MGKGSIFRERELERALSEASAEKRIGDEHGPIENWTDEELKNEFRRFYYKPLYHPTDRSSMCANDEDFAHCRRILQILVNRGYNKKQVIEEELKKLYDSWK